MRTMGITLRLGEKVSKIEEVSGNGAGAAKLMQATLESGKKLSAEALLYSVGGRGRQIRCVWISAGCARMIGGV
jgi:NAD(P) transhydrogenase